MRSAVNMKLGEGGAICRDFTSRTVTNLKNRAMLAFK